MKKKGIISIFLSLCMIIMCMAGLSVTAGAANSNLAILVFDDGNEVYAYNTWTEQGELLDPSVYTLSYTNSNGQAVTASDNWATVTATVTSGTNLNSSGSAKHSYVLEDNEAWSQIGSGNFLSKIEVYPSMKKVVAYLTGKPLPASWLTIGYRDMSVNGGFTEDDLSSTFPTAPGEYRAYITNVYANSAANIHLGTTEYATFTVAEPTDIALSTCTIAVDPLAPKVTITTSDNKTVPDSAYTLTYEQRIVNGDPLTWSGTGFPTDTGTWFVIADAVPNSGYTGRLTSDDFVIGYGGFAQITVNTTAKTVTVKNRGGQTVASSEYELGFYMQLTGSERYMGGSFPTDKGTYVAVAKGKSTSESYATSMVSSLPFTVEGITSITGGTLKVDTSAMTATLTVNGETVPTSGYSVKYIASTGTNTPEYESATFPTAEGTYFAVANGIKDKGYEGEVYSSDFKVMTKLVKLLLSLPKMSLKTGGEGQLKATYNDVDVTSSVTWTSSDTNVATVSDGGLVKGLSAGTATITAKADETATCVVTVEGVASNGGGTTPILYPSTPSYYSPTVTVNSNPATETTDVSGTATGSTAAVKTESTESKDSKGNDVSKTTTTKEDGSKVVETKVTDKSGNVVSETTKATVKGADGSTTTTTDKIERDTRTGTETKTETVVTTTKNGEQTVERTKTETAANGKQTVTTSTSVTNTKGVKITDTTKTYSNGTQIVQNKVEEADGSSTLSNVKFNSLGDIMSYLNQIKSAEGNTKKQTYAPDENGVTLTSIESSAKKSVTVSSKVTTPDGEKLPVTSIAANAFENLADTVKSITLPGTVTEIKAGAFNGTSVEKVTLKLSGKTRNALTKSIEDLIIETGALNGISADGRIVISTQKRLTEEQKAEIKNKLTAAGVNVKITFSSPK